MQALRTRRSTLAKKDKKMTRHFAEDSDKVIQNYEFLSFYPEFIDPVCLFGSLAAGIWARENRFLFCLDLAA